VTVTLLLFTLNEIDGMRAIVPQIDRAWVDQILVVDGGSSDGTIEWARDQGLEVMVQRRPGLGAAFTESLPLIRGDIAIYFSPDGNSVADRIPPLVDKMRQGYDIVTVSRYLGDAVSEDDDAITALGNWGFTTLVNLLFGSHLTDVLVMYKAYRTQLLRDVRVNTERNAWASQVLCRALLRGARMGEIPGDEPARIGGERKMSPLRFGSQELYTILRERLRGRP
jgi:glycosyltransferase involved in cell wall biosynthesis